MKFNVSGLSIAFYLFCGAVIFSEYNYVGPTTPKAFRKAPIANLEIRNHTKTLASKKEGWPVRHPASTQTAPMSSSSQYSGNVGLNNN